MLRLICITGHLFGFRQAKF